MTERTIIAQCTPLGGAIAMIRMSGDLSIEILMKLNGNKRPAPRMASLYTLDTGTIKDSCIVLYYEKGRSYTGEESVEIFCHGSAVITKELIAFALDKGAVLAEGGEFTKRAYLNRRIDLCEAEGILALINSETVEQAKSAFLGAEGFLSRKIEDMQTRLKKLIASIEVAIDYPEENIEQVAFVELKPEIERLLSEISGLISSFDDGQRMFNGIKVVLTGKTNVGKSSLFNALLGYKRAIVSTSAGTTRDVIEAAYIYKGRKFVLIDTAGLRTTKGQVELEGIKLALEQVQSADLTLGVGTAESEFVGKADLILTNKCDMGRGNGFNVSAKTGEGIEKLKEKIYELTDFEPRGIKVNLRQYEALKVAADALGRVMECSLSATLDCVSSDLYDAYNGLGKVTGVIGSDEIIAEIFSAFCVGK